MYLVWFLYFIISWCDSCTNTPALPDGEKQGPCDRLTVKGKLASVLLG